MADKTLKARDPFSGNSNTTVTVDPIAKSLYLVNDGAGNVNFTINSHAFILGPNEIFDELLDPFTQITVTTTSAYRGYVRGE